MGDLNLNYLDSSDHKELKELFTANGFKQIIREATRTTERSSTLIDVIFTTDQSHINASQVINCSMSDHDIIACSRKLYHITYEPEIIQCRDFSKYNVDNINNELLNAE